MMRFRAGWAVVACAVVAAVVVAVQPTGGYSYWSDWASLYGWPTFLQVGLLAAAGLAVLWPQPRVRRAAAVVGVAGGAQLAGTGVVAHRRWMTSVGWNNGALTNLDQLRLLAIILGVAGIVAVTACLRELWCTRAGSARPGRVVLFTAVVAAGVVAVLVPLVLGHDASSGATTALGAHALIYSLPWAMVLALGGVLDRVTALVGVLVVVVSAVPLLADQAIIPVLHPGRAFAVVSAVACSAAAIRVRPRSDQLVAEPTI